MEMSQIILNRRKELGLTLEQVGNAVGVGKSTVRKWENGDIENMRRDKIAALADVLKISVSYLMGWDELDKKSTALEDIGLDANELILIDTYRNMTSDGQRATLDTVKALYGTFKNKIDNISNDNQVG